MGGPHVGCRLKFHYFVGSFISPYISYGLIAWGQASKSHLEKLLILQKTAVRLINFLPFRTHAIPYFAQSNILPIAMLYFKLSSILMSDITTNSAPQNICNLFTFTQDIHQYNTRSASSGNYYINRSRLNHHKNFFSIVGAKIWNSIPESYRKLPKHIFKKKIQALLIVTLETLDSYADISTLISKIKRGIISIIQSSFILFIFPLFFPLLTNNVIKIDFFNACN